ncbi:hypothetical protein C5167_007952 [Papaver somniferum]|uniref:Uncharacterized protein n=1 Tax=Papaver somniferum TaxID=3469 RepID=A0A4Y7JW37_PAPSO|nr:hypothetical protein C5167_007952 [Papaver somniferum]
MSYRLFVSMSAPENLSDFRREGYNIEDAMRDGAYLGFLIGQSSTKKKEVNYVNPTLARLTYIKPGGKAPITETFLQDKGKQYVEKRWIRNRVFSELNGEIGNFLPVFNFGIPNPYLTPNLGVTMSQRCVVTTRARDTTPIHGATKQPNIHQKPLPAHPGNRGINFIETYDAEERQPSLISERTTKESTKSTPDANIRKRCNIRQGEEYSSSLPTVLARGNPTQIRPNNQQEAIKEDNFLIEQLRKTKADISIWGLLDASTSQRQSLPESLSLMHVLTGITPNELVHLIVQDARPGSITFTNDDLPPKGRDQNKGLYITIGWGNMIVPYVFMDNGAGVNICTLKEAKKMGIDMRCITKADESYLTVRSFNNGKRTGIGELTIEIWVGPIKTYATFLSMDISASFNFLLGRLWMHKNGIGASSLYQKVRFCMGNKLITIHGDYGENEIRSHQVFVNMVPEIHN